MRWLHGVCGDGWDAGRAFLSALRPGLGWVAPRACLRQGQGLGRVWLPGCFGCFQPGSSRVAGLPAEFFPSELGRRARPRSRREASAGSRGPRRFTRAAWRLREGPGGGGKLPGGALAPCPLVAWHLLAPASEIRVHTLPRWPPPSGPRAPARPEPALPALSSDGKRGSRRGVWPRATSAQRRYLPETRPIRDQKHT